MFTARTQRHPAPVLTAAGLCDESPGMSEQHLSLGQHRLPGYDEVVIRGNPADRVFTALWIKGSHVIAGMHVNDWDAIDALRNLVGNEADRLARDPQSPSSTFPGRLQRPPQVELDRTPMSRAR